MSSSRITFFLVAFAVALLPACGGGGNGFSIEAPPLEITSSTIDPTLVSGDTVDWMIPLDGGCSGVGPYVVEIIAGSLPDGVGVDYDGGRHHLAGVILEDGPFAFTVKVTDTSCEPFRTGVVEFSWNIGQGPVRVVGCNPPLIPVGSFDDPLKYADADALDTVVYGSFVNYDLIVAGGQGPYTCAIIDDPADLDDGGLPIGLSFAVNSCSLIGTPTQVGPGGRPFRYTIRVTDDVGNTSEQKFQHKIDTPPIIIAGGGAWNPGQAGVGYGDAITAVDGVPPLAMELLDNAPNDDGDSGTSANQNDNVTFTPGVTPVIAGFENPALPFQLDPLGPALASDNARLVASGGRVTYPLATDDGPNYGPMPSEGLYFTEKGTNAGNMFGTPRRRGTFTLNVHVYSTLVPNERGQHAFQAMDMFIADADPLTMELSLFSEPANPPKTGDAYPTLPEANATEIYNPDSGSHSAPGLLLTAVGGVSFDNKFDHPHEADLGVVTPPTEVLGKYTWTSNMAFDTAAPWGSQPNAIEVFDVYGRFGTGENDAASQANADSLFRHGRRTLKLFVMDDALPLSERTTLDQAFGMGVGPDTAIIASSTTSLTTSDFWWRENNRFRMNDQALKIEKFSFFGTTPKRKELEPSDMAATHTVPAIAGVTGSNPIGALISGVTLDGGSPTGGSANMDLMRCVINATGWWDDNFQMNPKGARPFTHVDPNKTDTPYGEFGQSYSQMGNHQPTTSAVDLPDVDSDLALDGIGGTVTIGIQDAAHDPANGVYMNGGLCYHFESNTQYGIFIVRPDAKVYVPFAEQKTSTTTPGFGDGLVYDKGSNTHSALRSVQMTVSPDGRFAAMKLKSDPNYLYEHADQSRILLVSLTGEKVFGGKTYRIVNTDATTLTGSSSARLLYASSMALTNDYLYFLIGSQSPTGNTTSTSYLYRTSWQGHFLMRLKVDNTSTPTKLPGPASDPTNLWKQDDSLTTPMQTVFHHHGPNSSNSSPYIHETYTSYGVWPYHRYFHEDGMNFHEHNVAPAPFRVSANGRAVAFFAAENYTGTSNANVYSTYAWVQYDGVTKRVTGSRRHHSVGSGRGYQTVHGPNEYSNWGRYHGPTPGVEISDDGLAVAFNYSNATSISASASYSSSSNAWRTNSEEALVTRSTSGTWDAFSESEITKNTFGGSHRWRFGSFAFTRDNKGVVFWGGSPMYQATSSSYSYNQSYHFQGTFYVHKLGDSNKVTSMMATAAGGSPDGAGKSYGVGTGLAVFNPTATSGRNNRYGAIHPFGGFLSKNRKFMYVATVGAVSSSDGTGAKLVAMNVDSPDGASVNGHAAGRGFVPSNWPSRRGLLIYYYYYYGNYYPLQNGYSPSKTQGIGSAVMAKDTGWVYFAANYQYTGPQNTGSNSYGQWAYPTYYNYGYGYGGVGLYAFNADMGGAIATLHQSSWAPQSTSQRSLNNLIEVSRDGSRLLNIRSEDTYTWYNNRERVRWVHNIDFNTSNGAMHSGFNPTNDAGNFESSNSRISGSVAVVNGGTDIFYAKGSSNENSKVITRQRFDPGTGNWTKLSNTSGAWYEILWAGR